MRGLLGDRLGQYQLFEVLGRGGMATVYRGHHAALGRDVAIKVLHDYLDPQAAVRFEREARAVARLQHPNILPIYDYGEHEGLRYFVTQYIPGGRTLADQIEAGAITPAAALALAAHVLEALAYAHEQGVIHRDIKPANIMLPRADWPLLGDFGIAEVLSATTQLTPAGQIIGTANYMAPERAADHPIDLRSDLYAMGVVLYEMLAGRLPFVGDSPVAVLIQHVNEPPPALSLFAPAVPIELERAVLQAMAKDPARRFQSAGEMVAELRAIGRRLEQRPAPPTLPLEAYLPPASPPAAPSAPPAAPAVPPQPRPAPAPPALPRPAAGVDSAAPARDRRWPWLIFLGLGLCVALAAAFWLNRPRLQTGLPVQLDDSVWTGGYGGAADPQNYGGRTATWVYGQGTGLSEMRASFELAVQPAGLARLTVEGMDAEGPAKTTILITVNGQPIYQGDNPLPNDDFVLATGTWASASWEFDAAILQPGRNEIAITNLDPGQFSRPPFFMLDYAEVALAE